VFDKEQHISPQIDISEPRQMVILIARFKRYACVFSARRQSGTDHPAERTTQSAR